jgi:hypothetical protein
LVLLHNRRLRGAAAKLPVTSNGGSSWSNADADPFGTDEHIQAVRAFVINPNTGGRVVAQNGSAAEIAWADFNWSDPTALTWTTVATTGNGKALGWRYYKELLIATASGCLSCPKTVVKVLIQL